jgi:NAD(P)-dependent dehydrogenase (short-subunit alcohol dehydrogenase family)
MDPTPAPRLALITGAASGLGLECARALAATGWRVILADRNVAGGQAAARELGGGAQFRALDLGDLAAIRAFAASLTGPLDLLLNVAGLLPPLQRATTRDGFELKFGVNHLGHFALTQSLLPALLRAPAPRVVSVSSIVAAHGRIDFDDLQAERGYDPQRAYRQAKLACLMFALELHDRARAAGWTLASIAAHPGIARTAIGADRKGQPHRRLRDHLEDWALAAAMRWFGQSAAEGAAPLLHAATAPDAESGAYYGPGGFGQFRGRPVRLPVPRSAADPALRRRLWDASAQLTSEKGSDHF